MNKPEGTKLICLTPVVNEAFELDRFLTCTSLWADHIIIGYQESIDNTLEIAQKYEKVTVVNSPNRDWNELAMRSLLYETARKIEADKRIIFNLDADELISANYMTSAEWSTILNLPKGSIVRMPWSNLRPDHTKYSIGNMIEVAFVDDEKSMIQGNVMHMGRVPWPAYDITILRCSEIKLLHYQSTNYGRGRAKVRWYSTYERVGKSLYGPNIYRKYFQRPPSKNLLNSNLSWFKGYNDLGIDVTSVVEGYDYSHDYRLLEYLDKYGTRYFITCDIWDMNWEKFAIGKKDNPARFRNPRNKMDHLVLKYMRWTALATPTTRNLFITRTGDRVLKLIGYSS